MALPVGGEGVATVVWLAELPPLMVWLGPGESLPVVGALLAGASPEPVGATEVLGLTDGGDVVAGAGTAADVVGVAEVVLLPGAALSSSLLQPDIKAIATAADERVSAVVRTARVEFFTAPGCPGRYPGKLPPRPRHQHVSTDASPPSRSRREDDRRATVDAPKPLGGVSSEALDDGGVGHAAALAHRLQGESSVSLF
ncbi:hypothetical protein [Mycolicibacterium hodleri]|nr:hypothetical protein [Mycolicibacterium hodleri]